MLMMIQRADVARLSQSKLMAQKMSPSEGNSLNTLETGKSPWLDEKMIIASVRL
jgi:hypothetical protein